MDKNMTPITSESKLFENIKCGLKLAKNTYSGCNLIHLNGTAFVQAPEQKEKETKIDSSSPFAAKFKKIGIKTNKFSANGEKSGRLSTKVKKLLACIVVGVLFMCGEIYAIVKINAASVKEYNKNSNAHALFVKTASEQVVTGHDIVKNATIAAAKKKEEEDAKKKAEEEAKAKAAKTIINANWNGSALTRSRGAQEGPSGRETYYNLDMSGVVSNMRRMGYDEGNYPYYVREDGAKMLGPYIMVAANLNLRPKGTLVTTSMGVGIVADTGGFAASNPTQIDIATNW